MKLFDRLRVMNFVSKQRENYIKAHPNATSDEVDALVLDAVKQEYSANVDWAKIIQLVLTLLAMFAK